VNHHLGQTKKITSHEATRKKTNFVWLRGAFKFWHRLECDSLPEALDSLAQAGAFWDAHSTADYEDVAFRVYTFCGSTGDSISGDVGYRTGRRTHQS